MLALPTTTLIDSLNDFAVASRIPKPIPVELGPSRALRLQQEDRLFYFGSLPAGMDYSNLVREFQIQLPDAFNESGIHEVIVGVGGALTSSVLPATVARGVRVLPMQDALAALVGLPKSWREQQMDVLHTVLRSVTSGPNIHVVSLRSDDGRAIEEALDGAPMGKLIYLRADAGKGKSTVLAWRTMQRLKDHRDELPGLFVPLRELKRSEGVSWGAIAGRLGVLGGDVSVFAEAVRAGLVHVALDGLDEVSGRYDPAVVKDVLDVLDDHIGLRSRVFLSGRTTESALLNPDRSILVGLRLPESTERDFASFVEVVIDRVANDWMTLFRQVPEPMLNVDDASELTERPLSISDKEKILEWVKVVFEDLGKDQSLFFVQSLVGAARTYQLAGNRALLIRAPKQAPKLLRPPVYDVARLAASLACVREVEKIENIAQQHFSVENQIVLLTWFAVVASTSDAVRNQLPFPNELIREVFDVDPTLENEVFTALIRQMQKHALLYANGVSRKAAEWRPQFLTDWTRNALLVRAWQHRDSFPGVPAELVGRAVACAEQAQDAFGLLFSEVLENAELEALGTILRVAAKDGSAEASANYWRLYAGLEIERRQILGGLAPLVEVSDLSGLEIRRINDANLYIKDVILYEAQIVDSFFQGLELTGSDLAEVVFTACTFIGGRISNNTGPCVFEDCTFEGTVISNFSGRGADLVRFVGCVFKGQSKIQQNEAASENSCERIVSFEDCLLEGAPADFLSGEWLGVNVRQISGLGSRRDNILLPKDQLVLRATLKTFFPRRAGDDKQLQVRQYIRSSALGRGALPEGSPTGETLFDILCTVGFTDGGRDRHLYAPWSELVGGGDLAIRLRNEFGDFMSRGITTGETVTALLGKIRKAANW